MKAIYSIATYVSASLLSMVAFAPISSSIPLLEDSRKEIDGLVQICESAGDSNARFQCLLDQGTQLNRAKNLARQRGERENGGVSVIETEPSMHGPSAEAPYTLLQAGGQIEYRFTFRLRPRATEDYTQQAEILVTYVEETREWIIGTISNTAIAPTPCSFASEQQNACF